MATTSQFASRYKKDLSVEAVRLKVTHRRSMDQKENRHKVFEKGRRFGLADINVQPSKQREISQLNEPSEMCSKDSSSVKPKQSTGAATKRMNKRQEMLQRYKEERELQKLKEQREKAKKGIFKVGLYRPSAPVFLLSIPDERVTVKPKEKVWAKGHSVRPTQAERKQMDTDEAAEKKKEFQPALQMTSKAGITRPASSAAGQMLKTTAAAATADQDFETNIGRFPIEAISVEHQYPYGKQSQRKRANGRKQKKAVKPDIKEVIPSKREGDENAQLAAAMEDSADDYKASVSVELQQEQTSAENKTNSASGRPRTRSFAPQNFVFQPLTGLATYKVTPMSPSRASAFLTPDAFWDFSKSPVTIIENPSEAKAPEPNLTSQVSPAGDSIQEQETTTSLTGEKASESGEKIPIQRSSETIPISTDITALEVKSDDVREEEHDVPYFRNILRSETERLTSQCLQWDGKFELDIPEDAKDLIRTTTGQTRLLIAERFKQFEGLVDDCEFKRGEKETTCTDLDGFWDMVHFQIEDVNKKFDNLKKLQDNGWQPLDVPSEATVKKKTVPIGGSKPKLGAAGRTAARNRLAAVKAALREKMKHDGAAGCTQQEKLPEEEKVVFDAGFFRIESPVKTFPGVLSKTPRRPAQQISGKQATPRSSSRALRWRVPSGLRNPEDATANQTTPVLEGSPPAQNLKMHRFPTGKAPPLEELSAIYFERSSSIEESPVAGTAEGTKVIEMATTSQFASRYKKDLSVEAVRLKAIRRISMRQKENRQKVFEKGRRFGLADINVQPSKQREISQLNEPSEDSSSVKQKQSTGAATKRMNKRQEMLQRYKEEKELQKLKEQREKAKKGIFKVGLYRPSAPVFLLSIPDERVTVKPKEKVWAKGHSVRPTQAERKQMDTDEAAEKKKEFQPALQMTSKAGITRPASSAAGQMLKTTAAAATAGKQSQRKRANGRKQKKAVKPNIKEVLNHQKMKLERIKSSSLCKVIPSKREGDENAQLAAAMEDSAADSKASVSVELQQEQTSAENKTNSASGRPRTRSFAPQNFVFQPLTGLATYKVTPMSPSRASAFLTPDAFWDFSKSPVTIIENPSEAKAPEPNLTSQVSPAGDSIQEQETTTSLTGEKAGESGEKIPIQRSSETIPISTDITALEVKSDDVREEEHDVPYFRNILRSETERLTSQCLQWDGKFELDIPEDAKDLIRTTTGQTRLLIAERFKQFEGLVDDCEFKRGEKETTCTDLDGFWDMVHFQIEDVNKKFDNLKKLQDNGWQPLDVPSKATVKKKTVPIGGSKPKLGAAGRTAARNRLAAVKAALREKMKHDGAAGCTQQEKLPEEEKVVFDAGFFRIESPVKTFPGVLSKTPRRPAQQISGKQATPRSSSRALRWRVPSGLRNPEDATANQTTPVLEGSPPAQNLKMHRFPTGKAPPLEELSAIYFERSSSIEESPVAGTAEGTKPMLDAEIPFTPLRSRAQKLAAAEALDDLIVFSPFPSSGEK